MNDALILARDKDYDVFNALDIFQVRCLLFARLDPGYSLIACLSTPSFVGSRPDPPRALTEQGLPEGAQVWHRRRPPAVLPVQLLRGGWYEASGCGAGAVVAGALLLAPHRWLLETGSRLVCLCSCSPARLPELGAFGGYGLRRVAGRNGGVWAKFNICISVSQSPAPARLHVEWLSGSLLSCAASLSVLFMRPETPCTSLPTTFMCSKMSSNHRNTKRACRLML